jgi:hypothetical protein
MSPEQSQLAAAHLLCANHAPSMGVDEPEAPVRYIER